MPDIPQPTPQISFNDLRIKNTQAEATFCNDLGLKRGKSKIIINDIGITVT